MTRKTSALLVAALTLIALVCVAVLVPMPYVVESPGVTENTLGSFNGKDVITIKGHKTYPTTGQLDLTTVSVTSPDNHLRLLEVIDAWWAKDEVLLPRDVFYPPDQTPAEVDKENQTQMLDSQQAAVVAGLAQAGIDAVKVIVEKAEKGAPSDGVLRKGDELVSADGKQIDSSDDVSAAIAPLKPGSDVTLGIVRNGKSKSVTLTTVASEDNAKESRIGISVGTAFDAPFDVNIDLGQSIGGPSAGLMFSLGIYDKITPGPLTGGKHIAGTGTIDANGTVGPIGGIQQKIAGALGSGANYFLVPADNCAEAAASSHVDDIELIKVATMGQAVRALDALSSGTENDIVRCEG